MPAFTAPDGTTKYVPRVYSTFEVIDLLPGAVPAFHVPVLVGDAERGIPYNFNDLKENHEPNRLPLQLANTSSRVGDLYGYDSELYEAMRVAKRHGLPTTYVVVINALTRASVIAESGTGAVQEAKVFARSFGTEGGWHKVSLATNVLTITPTKHFTHITANVGASDTRITVKDNSWCSVGLAVEVGDNANANVPLTIVDWGTEIDSNNQETYWVELSSAPGALTTAQYAALAAYDSTAQEVSPTASTGQDLVDWLRDTSQILDVAKEGTFSDVLWDPIVGAALKDLSALTPVGGTSPAGTVTEHDDFIGDLDASVWDDFVMDQEQVPRAFHVVSSSSSIHSSWRDWAISKRTEGYPIYVVAGAAWGDVVLDAGDDTDPKFRTGNLDSQDFALVVGGWNRVGAYKSTATAVWAMRVAGGVVHNLTNDPFRLEGEPEVKWDERNSGELTALLRAGCVTYKAVISNDVFWGVSQGLSTLQQNSKSWNADTKTTPLTMQRDIADAVDAYMRTGLEVSAIGADEVSTLTVGAELSTRGDHMEFIGWVQPGSFAVTANGLDASGNGINASYSVKLPLTNDFIGLTAQIVIG